MQETVWLKTAGDNSAFSTTTLILRSDGTYTKKLEASLQGVFGGIHLGRWTQQGDILHLSGDGNWPPCTENLTLFHREKNSLQEASLDSAGFQPSSFADVMNQVNTMMALDKRFIATLNDLEPGRAKDALITELEVIQHGYEDLLQQGTPSYPLYSLNEIRGKIGETLDSIARAHDSMNAWEPAVSYYEKAATLFESIGDLAKAQRSRNSIGRLKLQSQGDIDAEIRRLRALLEITDVGTLAHAELMLELGELYAKASDDYESEKFLISALGELITLGEDPSAADMAEALTKTLSSIGQGSASPGKTPLENIMKLRLLYTRCYLALAQLYKSSNPVKAAKYLDLVDKQNAKALNAEVVELLSKSLPSNSGKMAAE